MKALNRNIFFFLLIAVTCTFHLIEFFEGSLTLLSSYFDDVAIIPLMAGFALRMQQRLFGPLHFTFMPYVPVLLWCYMVLVFECLLPMVNTAYTADIADGIAYAAGAVLFYYYDNKPGLATIAQ